jgi:predicted GNAT superfamily acetyltransferase
MALNSKLSYYTTHTLLLKIINKFIKLKVLRCLVLTEINSNLHELTSEFCIEFQDKNNINKYFTNRYTDITEDIKTDAITKCDDCLCIFDSEKNIAAYSWFSAKDTWSGMYDLDFEISPEYIYTYKVFTDTKFRGQRLHAHQMKHALDHYQASGFKGIICHVYSDNYNSLKSSYRMGFKDIGSYYVLNIFNKTFHFNLGRPKELGLILK